MLKILILLVSVLLLEVILKCNHVKTNSHLCRVITINPYKKLKFNVAS